MQHTANPDRARATTAWRVGHAAIASPGGDFPRRPDFPDAHRTARRPGRTGGRPWGICRRTSLSIAIALLVAISTGCRIHGDGDRPDHESPEVTIAAAIDVVTEGKPADFTITAAPAPAADLMVSVTVDETGAMLPDPSPQARTVTITAGATEASLTVATDDDATHEPASVVTATVTEGTGYQLGTETSASVEVSDNEGPDERPEVEVTIAAVTAMVTEGTAAEFTVTAAPAPAHNLAVNVEVTETGDMLAAALPETVTIAAGATEASLTVATDDDATHESASVVTAMVTEGTGYEPGAEASATVSVEDDDEPVGPLPQGGKAEPFAVVSPAESEVVASGWVPIRLSHGWVVECAKSSGGDCNDDMTIVDGVDVPGDLSCPTAPCDFAIWIGGRLAEGFDPPDTGCRDTICYEWVIVRVR